MRKIRLITTLIVLLSCQSSSRPLGSNVPSWTVEDEPLLIIGTDEARQGHTLFRVVGATRLSNGEIVVADGGTSEIRFFRADGTLNRTIGGIGSGPEEFGQILKFTRIAGDTLMVLANDGNVSVLLSEPAVIRREPFRYPYFVLHCRIASVEDIDFLSSTTAVISAEDNFGIEGCPDSPEGSYRTTVLLALYRWLDGAVDTLGVYPGIDRNGPRFRVYGRGFARAVAGDRIFGGDMGSDSVHVFSRRGRPTNTWSVPLAAEEIGPQAKSLPAPQPTTREGEGLRTFPPFDYPDRYPVFARLLTDAAGALWVMQYPELTEPAYAPNLEGAYPSMVPSSGAEWLVLDSNGRTLAKVRTPPELFVLEAGPDYVLGIARDALDVESIRLHRLSR